MYQAEVVLAFEEIAKWLQFPQSNREQLEMIINIYNIFVCSHRAAAKYFLCYIYCTSQGKILCGLCLRG